MCSISSQDPGSLVIALTVNTTDQEPSRNRNRIPLARTYCHRHKRSTVALATIAAHKTPAILATEDVLSLNWHWPQLKQLRSRYIVFTCQESNMLCPCAADALAAVFLPWSSPESSERGDCSTRCTDTKTKWTETWKSKEVWQHRLKQ